MVLSHCPAIRADLRRNNCGRDHPEALLDESEVPCYTECEDSKWGCSKHDQDTFPLPRQDLLDMKKRL